MPDSIRVDKWLWAVRIFKTRTQATTACKSGRVRIKEHSIKPSTLITSGVIIEVKKAGFNFVFQVEKIIAKRVGAALAQPCYKNLTPETELNKYKNWFIGKAPAEYRQRGSGRPTKTERRALEDFKGSFYENFDELD